jgi:hypothetical protein
MPPLMQVVADMRQIQVKFNDTTAGQRGVSLTWPLVSTWIAERTVSLETIVDRRRHVL